MNLNSLNWMIQYKELAEFFIRVIRMLPKNKLKLSELCHLYFLKIHVQKPIHLNKISPKTDFSPYQNFLIWHFQLIICGFYAQQNTLFLAPFLYQSNNYHSVTFHKPSNAAPVSLSYNLLHISNGSKVYMMYSTTPRFSILLFENWKSFNLQCLSLTFFCIIS